MTPLTDEEFNESGLPESYRGFAYWDEEGYRVTISMCKAAIDSLKPDKPQ